MPERKDQLTKIYCGTCKKETMHVRYVGWHRDNYRFWKETLKCGTCKKERDRYALPIEQDRLDERYPNSDVVPESKPEMDAMPLFDSLESEDD